MQRMGHARAAVVAGRPQLARESHVGALVRRGVAGPVAGGLHPQDRRGDDHRRQHGGDDDAASRWREPSERRQAHAGRGHRRSSRMAATVERELPCVGRTIRSRYRRRLRRTAPPHRRAMARIFSVHGESGWLNTGWTRSRRAPRRSPAHLRSEDRGEASGVEARQRIAPIHDPGVGDPPKRRGVAHARRQLVGKLRHLLGLGGEDERAARQRGGELAGDLGDVALVLERRDSRSPVPREEGRRQHGQRSEKREPAEAEGDKQCQWGEHHHEVAQRPRGRPEARVGEGGEQRGRADDCHAQHRTARTPSAAHRRDPEPDRGGGQEHELGPRPAPDPGHGTGQRAARRAVRPRRAGVGGLVEQRGHPRREEQRRAAEGQ